MTEKGAPAKASRDSLIYVIPAIGFSERNVNASPLGNRN